MGDLMSRAPWIIEFVTIAMAILGPMTLLGASQAKKRNYRSHKIIQSSVAVTLLVAVILFEVQVRFLGWRQAAEASLYFDSLVFPVLYVHIPIAIITAIAWIQAIREAMKVFKTGYGLTGDAGNKHRFWGKIAVMGTQLTWITGWIFFYLAFVAS